MNVSAIVPAYNEAERIGAVLRPLTEIRRIEQIIVVDDGSTDHTAHVAQAWGAEVVRLPENCGKATALDRGVRQAHGEVLLFLDADLVGFQARHVQTLLDVYEGEGADMVVGIFKNGRLNTDLSQKFAPYLSGQRVLSKALWQRLCPQVDGMEFGVEIALQKLALKEGLRVVKVELDGVTHVMKEEKRGLGPGLKDRFKMYRDIVRSVFTRVG